MAYQALLEQRLMELDPAQKLPVSEVLHYVYLFALSVICYLLSVICYLLSVPFSLITTLFLAVE